MIYDLADYRVRSKTSFFRTCPQTLLRCVVLADLIDDKSILNAQVNMRS